MVLAIEDDLYPATLEARHELRLGAGLLRLGSLVVSWSDASEGLAIAATLGGGVVLDADDGSPQTARCGLAFEVRHSPPVVQGFLNQQSVCEL